MNRARPLITAKWLNDKMYNASNNIRVLETSFAPPGKGLESYLEQHIPRASFFDMWRCCHPTQYVARPMHEPLCFQDYTQSLGVSHNSHIVIYDKGSLFFAARLWYTFKAFGHSSVSVLNGGFPSWVRNGYDSESGEDTQELPRGDFFVRRTHGKFLTFDEVQKTSGQMLDVRALGHFRGEKREPSESTIAALSSASLPLPEGMVAGHVPGARHLKKDLFIEKGSMEVKGSAEIKKVFQQQGVDLNRPITAMCYNGVSACLVPLVAAEMGKEDVSVYVGSWTEYGQRAKDSDTEKGDGTPNPPVAA